MKMLDWNYFFIYAALQDMRDCFRSRRMLASELDNAGHFRLKKRKVKAGGPGFRLVAATKLASLRLKPFSHPRTRISCIPHSSEFIPHQLRTSNCTYVSCQGFAAVMVPGYVNVVVFGVFNQLLVEKRRIVRG